MRVKLVLSSVAFFTPLVAPKLYAHFVLIFWATVNDGLRHVLRLPAVTKKQHPQGVLIFLVEVRRIELLSEIPLFGISTCLAYLNLGGRHKASEAARSMSLKFRLMAKLAAVKP